MKVKNIVTALFVATFAVIGLTIINASASTPIEPWVTKITGDMTINRDGTAALGSGVIVNADISSSAAIGESKLDAQANDGSDEGLFADRVARFIYDVAADGGTVGARGLGVTLPGGAVIIRSYFKIITQFVDSGSGTVALSCEDANNIKTATDITGSSANAFIEGQSTGAASAFVRDIAADCEITATVAASDQTAGKLVGWVHYVIED